jgi:hypothetical protein
MKDMTSASQLDRRPDHLSQDSQAALLALYAEHGEGLVSAAGHTGREP